MENGWRRRTELFYFEEGTFRSAPMDLISRSRKRGCWPCRNERPPRSAALLGVPGWVVQECAQSTEMIDVEMLLLSA